MTDEQKKKEYYARQERLKRVADNIDRGIGGKFYGADFHLGFNFMYCEIVELQKEFNARFAKDMPSDPRFTEFYDRIIQILESSEAVLLDSISPIKNKKEIADRVAALKLTVAENQDTPENSKPTDKPKTQQKEK